MIKTTRNNTLKKGKKRVVSIPSSKLTGGVGSIIIPGDIDRDSFVESCYRTNTVSIIIEKTSQRYDNVRIDSNILDEIDFPKTYKDLGSLVVWVFSTKHNQPIIIGKIDKDDQVSNCKENGFKTRREFNGNIIEIDGDANSGAININILSQSEDEDNQINLNVSNAGDNASVNVDVTGNVNVRATQNVRLVALNKMEFQIKNKNNKPTYITYEQEAGFTYLDEFNNKVTIGEDGIKFYEGSEPLVLGTTLQEQLNIEKARVSAIISAINNSPVVAGDGGASFKAALISALSSIQAPDYSNINSEKAFTD